MRFLTLTLAVSLAAIVPTHAQSLTNDRACAEVQRDYARTGRVVTRSRSGAVLPIYGGIPYLVRKNVFCGPNQIQKKKYVVTRDKRMCAVASRCI